MSKNEHNYLLYDTIDTLLRLQEDLQEKTGKLDFSKQPCTAVN